MGWLEKRQKEGYCPSSYYSLCLCRCSTCNVCQCPCCFKLERWTVTAHRNWVPLDLSTDFVTYPATSIPEQRTHLSWHSRQWTSIGSISLSIRASIGGLRSEDRSFRADWTAFSCTTGSSLAALATSCSRFVVAKLLSKSSSSETSADYDFPMLRFSTHYTMTNHAQYNSSHIITSVPACTLNPKFNPKILGKKKKKHEHAGFNNHQTLSWDIHHNRHTYKHTHNSHSTRNGQNLKQIVHKPVESATGTFRRFCNVSSLLFFLSSTVTSFLRLLISCQQNKQLNHTAKEKRKEHLREFSQWLIFVAMCQATRSLL